MNSCILAFTVLRRSLGEQSSRTKSGQSRSKCSLGSGFIAFQRDFRVHEASGDRLAPFANVYRALESHATPVPSFLAQFVSWYVISAFCRAVSRFVGDMMISSFWAVSSM